jgi:hypothetical protein
MWLVLLAVVVTAAICFIAAAVWLSQDESVGGRPGSAIAGFAEGCRGMSQTACAGLGAGMLERRGASAAPVACARVPRDPSLLPRRLARLGIDPGRIARTEPAVLRRLVIGCRKCRSAERCANDLSHSASEDWKTYCVNAATLRMLAASMPAAGGHRG